MQERLPYFRLNNQALNDRMDKRTVSKVASNGKSNKQGHCNPSLHIAINRCTLSIEHHTTYIRARQMMDLILLYVAPRMTNSTPDDVNGSAAGWAQQSELSEELARSEELRSMEPSSAVSTESHRVLHILYFERKVNSSVDCNKESVFILEGNAIKTRRSTREGRRGREARASRESRESREQELRLAEAVRGARGRLSRVDARPVGRRAGRIEGGSASYAISLVCVHIMHPLLLTNENPSRCCT